MIFEVIDIFIKSIPLFIWLSFCFVVLIFIFDSIFIIPLKTFGGNEIESVKRRPIFNKYVLSAAFIISFCVATFQHSLYTSSVDTYKVLGSREEKNPARHHSYNVYYLKTEVGEFRVADSDKDNLKTINQKVNQKELRIKTTRSRLFKNYEHKEIDNKENML